VLLKQFNASAATTSPRPKCLSTTLAAIPEVKLMTLGPGRITEAESADADASASADADAPSSWR